MAQNGFREKKRCGVLGATGSVGQRFILLLADHPVLKLQAVGASSRSAGKTYKEAVRWKQQRPMSKTSQGWSYENVKPANSVTVIWSSQDWIAMLLETSVSDMTRSSLAEAYVLQRWSSSKQKSQSSRTLRTTEDILKYPLWYPQSTSHICHSFLTNRNTSVSRKAS